MCDDDIHPGLVHDPRLSRRAFGLAAAALGGVAATAAGAQSPVVEKDVEIKTPDGVADAALFYPEGKGTWPAVLIWPDVLSLRPAFRDMGKRLAAAGYVVLVVNLYYRVKKAPVIEQAFDFSKPDDRAKLTPMRATVTPEGTDRDAAAYVAFLDAQPQTNKARRPASRAIAWAAPCRSAPPRRRRAGSARWPPSTAAAWSPTSRPARIC
jgi:carboxymethylenebutenolidase